MHHVLELIATRRGPLGSRATRAAVEQLRQFAHDDPDPALRAAVHVACAHLSAGDLDETDSALDTAARILSNPTRRVS